MADQMLFISWGPAVRGREERGLEVFNEALGLMGRMQQDGRIESFDVALLRPNNGIAGYVQVNGTAEQIAALRTDQEFMQNTMDAQLIVENLCHAEGFTGAGVAQQMDMYRAAIAKVPQTA
jgi:hypothetical protein